MLSVPRHVYAMRHVAHEKKYGMNGVACIGGYYIATDGHMMCFAGGAPGESKWFQRPAKAAKRDQTHLAVAWQAMPDNYPPALDIIQNPKFFDSKLTCETADTDKFWTVVGLAAGGVDTQKVAALEVKNAALNISRYDKLYKATVSARADSVFTEDNAEPARVVLDLEKLRLLRAVLEEAYNGAYTLDLRFPKADKMPLVLCARDITAVIMPCLED